VLVGRRRVPLRRPRASRCAPRRLPRRSERHAFRRAGRHHRHTKDRRRHLRGRPAVGHRHRWEGISAARSSHTSV